MQIVINLPENVYKHIMEMEFCISGIRSGKGLLDKILCAIRTGTPLPKGHGRLIDASNLMTVTDYDGENEKTYIPYDEIDNAPTIIEADKVESEGKE